MNLLSLPNHRRRRNRAKQRGAAMIEGIIVMSTMLVFLGLIVFTRQAYGMKLDMQQRTRSDTLYYASHACEQTGGGVGSQGGGGTVPGSAGPAGAVASKSSLPDAAAVKRNWNLASGSLNGSVDWQAIWDTNAKGNQNESIQLQKNALKSNVTAASGCGCNEKKYGSQLTAWFQFGADFLRTGGGVGGLFN